LIERITGTLVRTGVNDITLEQGGIGFRILMPPLLIEKLPGTGGRVTLYTTLLMREELPCLYGFLKLEERDLFEDLIGVAGIGPKAAMGIVGSLSPDRLYSAVVNEEIKTLTAVPGIGPKSARRLVLELKEKFSRSIPGAEGRRHGGEGSSPWEDSLDALLYLGYSSQEVLPVLAALIRAKSGEEPTREEIIRLALKRLGEVK